MSPKMPNQYCFFQKVRVKISISSRNFRICAPESEKFWVLDFQKVPPCFPASVSHLNEFVVLENPNKATKNARSTLFSFKCSAENQNPASEFRNSCPRIQNPFVTSQMNSHLVPSLSICFVVSVSSLQFASSTRNQSRSVQFHWIIRFEQPPPYSTCESNCQHGWSKQSNCIIFHFQIFFILLSFLWKLKFFFAVFCTKSMSRVVRSRFT